MLVLQNQTCTQNTEAILSFQKKAADLDLPKSLSAAAAPPAVIELTTATLASSVLKKNLEVVVEEIISSRLRLWLDKVGGRDRLVSEYLEQSSVRPPLRKSDAEANIRRAVRLMREDGQYGKAAKALSSCGVAPFNQDTFDKLKELHPSSNLPTWRNVDEVHSFRIDLRMVQGVLRSFPKRTGGGQSGLRVQRTCY